jgi:hypothetical protein
MSRKGKNIDFFDVFRRAGADLLSVRPTPAT